MYVPFSDLSPQARVWVYQSDRKLSDAEILLIEEAALSFLDGWAAHGKPLKSSFQVFHSQFLVMGVDEGVHSASGCSIDSSVSFIKALEKELEVNFLDRGKVAFIVDNSIFLETLTQLKSSISQGKIKADTRTFNNMISKKQELEESWLMPAKDTWLKKYFD